MACRVELDFGAVVETVHLSKRKTDDLAIARQAFGHQAARTVRTENDPVPGHMIEVSVGYKGTGFRKRAVQVPPDLRKENPALRFDLPHAE